MREIDRIARKTSPEFSLWSGLRKRLFLAAPLYPIVLFGISLVLCVAGASRGKVRAIFPPWPVPAMMTFIAVSCFLFSSLLDAAETARHLLLFHVATDLTILSLFLAAVGRKPERSAIA